MISNIVNTMTDNAAVNHATIVRVCDTERVELPPPPHGHLCQCDSISFERQGQVVQQRLYCCKRCSTDEQVQV